MTRPLLSGDCGRRLTRAGVDGAPSKPGREGTHMLPPAPTSPRWEAPLSPCNEFQRTFQSGSSI